MRYIDSDKLIASIEEYRDRSKRFILKASDKNLETTGLANRVAADTYNIVLSMIASLQQEQPDTCIFGNTPSESSCKFCGVECALREPKQTGTTSAVLSSKDEAIGLAIMAYLDTKVKHDNAKVCGVSLKVAREWIREKIANKQAQPEGELENYISNKLRELGADLINHKPYSFNRGLNVGKTNAYDDILNRLNARKEE